MAWKPAFRPRIVDSLRDYDRRRFVADVNAGLVVGVVALSLCIGLGIASGATPEAGLYAGFIGGLLVSLLGGSRVQIGGPAGAFVGMVAAIVAQHGMGALLFCTLLAGVILVVMGALRLGVLIKFVPHPLIMGFTCGIAVVIISSQVSTLLGLSIANEPTPIPAKLVALVRGIASLHGPTAILGVATVVLVRFWPGSWQRRVPGSIVAVVAGSAAVAFSGLDVATIGSRFGGIPQGLPGFQLPGIELGALVELSRVAFAMAMLCGIESLLSAVVADGMSDDRHDSNQELMAQGVANIVSPLFGGLPVTGVIARTATNIRSGGTTPVAGIVHALVLLAVLLVAAPLAKFVPLAVLAGVLIHVALRMGEWSEFAAMRRYPAGDAAVFLTSFLLTVLVDLTLAIEVGMLLSAFLFIKRVTDSTHVAEMEGEKAGGPAPSREPAPVLPPGVLVYRIFGSLLFGAAEKLEYVLRRVGRDTRVVILNVAPVTAMDATALHRLEDLHKRLRRGGRHLVLSGPHTQPYFLMENAGFFDELGRDNVVADLEHAARRAREILDTRRDHGPAA